MDSDSSTVLGAVANFHLSLIVFTLTLPYAVDVPL
jgi:hypothetical protein